MALNKAVSTGFGNDAEYWKIANVTEDYIAGCLSVVMAGYLSSEARLASAQPAMRRDIRFSGEGFTHDMDRAAIYTALKLLPDWAGATDC
jgi:hypothetical protein